MMDSHQRLTKCGDYIQNQDSQKIQHVAALSREVLDDLLSQCRPGFTETQLHHYFENSLAKHNIDRIWHKPYIRFGTNTTLTFLDKSENDIMLQENDIAFVDIGIVIDGIEGDVGKTITIGDQPNPIYYELIQASEELFKIGRQYWLNTNATGIELYRYLDTQTQKLGFDFNLPKAGHLIGSFSHAGDGAWRDGLSSYPKEVETDRWILEIQIKHKSLPYGAFFEDLLSQTELDLHI